MFGPFSLLRRSAAYPRISMLASRSARLSGVLALTLLCATAAQAMTIRQFKLLEANEKNGKAYAGYYLAGVMEGLREASEASQREGQKPPFCVENRKLDPEMARSLYQTELKRNADSYEADMPVQLVLSAALRNSYRCTH
ncbi:MAG: hypothetical protein JWQ73_784 [Variovorax sp.]|nr:hypothetical protein [Variovorax sp.]